MADLVPEIPGVPADRDMARMFQEEVASLLGRTQRGFPGAQPVSFSRRHLQELQTKECVTVVHGNC